MRPLPPLALAVLALALVVPAQDTTWHVLSQCPPVTTATLLQQGQRSVTPQPGFTCAVPAASHACRFWGMVGTSPQQNILDDQLVSGTHSLLALGESNPHGWGVAYYSDPLLVDLDRPQLLRGGPKANHDFDDGFRDAVAEMLALDAHSAVVHVRKATSGHTGVPDPHPFWRGGLTFAHNGGLDIDALVSVLEQGDPDYLDRYPPHYQNPYLDSELLLLSVLKFREQRENRHDGVVRRALSDAVCEAALQAYDAGAINTAVNCLVTAGDTLIALRFDVNDVSRYRVRYLETAGAWIVASQPVGTDTTGWDVLPPKSMGIFTATAPPEIITIYPPQGPRLVLGERTIDDDLQGDSAGNGDGACDAGERVELIVPLHNEGTETATNVRATIETEDPHCEILDAYEEYGDIASGEEVPCLEDFDLLLDPQCPDGHEFEVTMTVESDNRLLWRRYFTLDVEAPVMEFVTYTVNDAVGGNGNGRIEPGEVFTLTTTLANTGSEDATNLQVQLGISHLHATVVQGEATLVLLPAGGEATPSAFEVYVDETCPDPDALFPELNVLADWNLAACLQFLMPVGGFFDDMESEPSGWTSYPVSDGFVDEWHLSSQRNYTPGGAWSWKFGDTGSGNYANLADGALESEPATLLPNSLLRFHHWMDAEVSSGTAGYCYDGGMVEMSVDGGPWAQISPVGGYPYRIRVGGIPGPWPVETEVYSGAIDWVEAVFEITGCQGEARFRFRFGSDGADTQEGWYIDDVEFFGYENAASGAEEVIPLRLHHAVEQNYPNPFGLQTVISYHLCKPGDAHVRIFNLAGRHVRTLVSGRGAAGTHRVTWDGRNDVGVAVSSGVYFYRLETEEGSHARKITLLR